MATRYKVVTDVGDGSVVVEHATRARIFRELGDGKHELVISVDQPSGPRAWSGKHEPEDAA